MQTYRLCASREACDMIEMGHCDVPTLDAAQTWADELVQEAEDDGTWPEGYDAVLIAPDGSYQLLTDQWEQGLGVILG